MMIPFLQTCLPSASISMVSILSGSSEAKLMSQMLTVRPRPAGLAWLTMIMSCPFEKGEGGSQPQGCCGTCREMVSVPANVWWRTYFLKARILARWCHSSTSGSKGATNVAGRGDMQGWGFHILNTTINGMKSPFSWIMGVQALIMAVEEPISPLGNLHWNSTSHEPLGVVGNPHYSHTTAGCSISHSTENHFCTDL